MNIQQIQDIIKENSHGMLFGLIASLIVLYIKKIQDPQVLFVISLISIIAGAIITYKLKIPRGFLTKQAVLIIGGLIILISFFGIQLDIFSASKSIWAQVTKFIFGKVIGVTLFAGLLSTFNIFFGIIALIIGLIILGIPLAGLIKAITDNLTLIIIVIGISSVFGFMLRKK